MSDYKEPYGDDPYGVTPALVGLLVAAISAIVALILWLVI